jgi:uncharacterized protein (TIGR03437 family)
MIGFTLVILLLGGSGGTQAAPTPTTASTSTSEPTNTTTSPAAPAPKPQGMGPTTIATTTDGQYAYVGFHLSDVVFKIRLKDLTIEAVADLSKYFPLQCYHIVLDASDKKLFVHSASWRKLLVLDAGTMNLIHTIDNVGAQVGAGGIIRSQHGPSLLMWEGNTVKFVNTETYQVTDSADHPVGFLQIRETKSDPRRWYVATTAPAGWVVGIYDWNAKAWVRTVTVAAPAQGGWLPDLKVSADERKLYAAAWGGHYPETQSHGYGWLISVDLAGWQAKVIPIEGGALSLEMASDGRRVYVGAEWPSPPDARNIQVVDTQTDTVVGWMDLSGLPRSNFNFTEIRDLQLDSVNPRSLYAVSNDFNAFIKIDVDSRSLKDTLVFNQESFGPRSFVRRPMQANGYILLNASPYAFELDLDNAAIKSVVKFPSYPGDVAINKAGRLLIAQGQSLLEADPADMNVVAIHRLPPGIPAMWDFLLSRDETRIYAISCSTERPPADTFVAINASNFQVEAAFRLEGGGFLSRPYELPDRPKLYAVGGMFWTSVVVHVIRTDNYNIQKTITFTETTSGISTGGYPFVYDSRSRTLFVGAGDVVLAIDTDADVIKKVIYLGDAARAIGLEPHQFIWVNAAGLIYHPQENYLYIAHGDRAFVSIYDLNKDRFLPQVIPLHGFFPTPMSAKDDYSKIYCVNTRSDNVSVIDVKSKTEEKVIDLHMYLPSPEPPKAGISVSRAELGFSFEMGGKVPASQGVLLWNVPGGSDVNWTAASSADWLAVSPSSGWTPSSLSVSVSPSKLGAGSYAGSVTVSSPGLPSETIRVTLRVAAPVPSISSIVNAASFQAGMVPGGLATLFGRNLSLVTGTELPGGATLYKGVSVTVEGRQVPLLAVSNVSGQEQINFQVPFELGAPARVRVAVNNNGSVATMENVPVLRVQPGIFEYTPQGSSTRYAAAVKLNGSVVGPTNPVSRGEVVSVFLTGMGPVLPILRTGEAGPANPPAVTWLQPTVAVGGIGAEVLFSGYAPGLLGLYQINIVIPDAAPAGSVNLDVVVDGVPSQSSKIAVR